MPWHCVRCDALWEDSQTHCDLDGTPRLYTIEEVEVIRAEARAALEAERTRLAPQVAALSQQLQQKNDELRQLQEQLRTALTPSPAPPPPRKAPEPVGKTARTSMVQPSARDTSKNSLGMEFVLIPAGEFIMGSNDYNDEKLIHRVRISKAFYLGKYEVTQAQWHAVMGSNPSRFKGDTLPVEQVSWEDAQEFIRRLNADGTKYRLPTEAEWEYAARAATTTAYSFGDDPGQLGEYAWFGANSRSTTHTVGRKRPNKWGSTTCMGMSGNGCRTGMGTMLPTLQ